MTVVGGSSHFVESESAKGGVEAQGQPVRTYFPEDRPHHLRPVTPIIPKSLRLGIDQKDGLIRASGVAWLETGHVRAGVPVVVRVNSHCDRPPDPSGWMLHHIDDLIFAQEAVRCSKWD
jgi:hypothetical protein